MREIRFGIIGCGLMGREFASAIARWCHLLDVAFKPALVGICDTNPSLFGWYRQHFPTIKIATSTGLNGTSRRWHQRAIAEANSRPMRPHPMMPNRISFIP